MSAVWGKNRFPSTQTVIVQYFHALPAYPVTRRELNGILFENRAVWKAPKSFNVDQLITLLTENDALRPIELVSAEYGVKQRHILGSPSVLQIATSFYKDSFLSHDTALFSHGLAELGHAIYANHEQFHKPTSSTLSQAAIDRAFANQQRQSSYTFRYGPHQIVFLNGKHTGQAGFVEMAHPDGYTLRYTDLERTLLDAIVRPRYCGTNADIMKAFGKAASKVSSEHLADLIMATQYTYPYQQSLGSQLRCQRESCDKKD